MATERKEKKPAAAKPEKAKAAPKAASPQTAAAAPADTRTALEKRRVVVGTVVSDKMQKTIVVKVDRRVRHGMYGKYITRSRKFKAHDEKNTAKTGDLVSLVESRPLSSDKRWVLREIVRRAGIAPEINV